MEDNMSTSMQLRPARFPINRFLLFAGSFVLLNCTGLSAQEKTPSIPQQPPGAYAQREQLASQAIVSKLSALRSRGQSEHWTFRVGYTKALDVPLENLVGVIPPPNLVQLAYAQNLKAAEFLKGAQFALRIQGTQRNACQATSTAFDWRSNGGETPV